MDELDVKVSHLDSCCLGPSRARAPLTGLHNKPAVVDSGRKPRVLEERVLPELDVRPKGVGVYNLMPPPLNVKHMIHWADEGLLEVASRDVT